VIKALRADTNNQRIFGYSYNFSSLKQVREFAAHLRRDAAQFFDGRLSCLVNNAGVFMEEREVTGDGLEATWAVNVAAPFLLTAELLDLIAAASGRVVNVSSISLADGLDFGNTQQASGAADTRGARQLRCSGRARGA
jgi:NAD(P)-dependent dehydrogenase (short-subunit alcohol dehydrogenase family)